MTELLGGIDDMWWVRKDINQVGEEAVAQAQEQARQAKQISQQIKKDKAINLQFAKFLSFLLAEIKSEEIIKEVYNTFYKTINPTNNITYLRKDANTLVMAGFFVPFFMQDAQRFGIMPAYSRLQPESAQTLRWYVDYLGRLSATYHDNIPINQTSFINLIILIASHYLNTWGLEDTRESVIAMMYGNNPEALSNK